MYKKYIADILLCLHPLNYDIHIDKIAELLFDIELKLMS